MKTLSSSITECLSESAINTTKIDNYFKTHKEVISDLLFDCKFKDRTAKIARLSYDVFNASSPKESAEIIEYIWDNHIPQKFHDKFS